MSVIGVVLAASMSGPARSEPVLWLNPAGSVLVEGKPVKARLTPGGRTVRTPFGIGLDLNGTRGGLLLEDDERLRLTKSITVSTWIYLRSYVNDGPGAQVLFRGDDRSGLDPYTLAVLSDGTIHFAIGGEDGNGADVGAEIPLNQWVRVTGSYDASGGELKLWLGERLISTRITTRHPFYELDAGTAPGIGIGNVQNDHGPHNQPLNGMIADLRLYSTVLDPMQLDWNARRIRPEAPK